MILHYLTPHSSDYTLPLDLCFFNSSKKLMSNYWYIWSPSKQINQIIKIHTSLYHFTSQLKCGSAFRSIWIDTQVRILYNNVKILASFNLDYQISHIEQLINVNFQLTPIQQYIYYCYKLAWKINRKANIRITMPYFSTQNNKNFLFCLIFIIPSKTHEN